MNHKENLTAREMMETRFLRLRPEMDVYEAVDLLLKYHVANAPVVDEEGCIIGFLSEKDCMQTLLDGAYSSNPSTSVDNCMTRDVMTIAEDTDLLTIAEIFLQTPYRRLPVVRSGRLIGLISRRNFLRAVADWTRPKVEHRPAFLYLSTIADRSVMHIA